MKPPGSTHFRGRVGDLIVAVAAIAVLGWTVAVSTGEPGGAVELLPAEFDLGSIPEGEDRTVVLTVTNRGPGRISAVLVPSCTCVTPAAGRLELAPRSSRTFPVRISTARRPGFNIAHVQVEDGGGALLAQARMTFTAVTSFVLEPPVLFLRAGEDRVAAEAFCLAECVPADLRCEPGDPAIRATAARAGRRRWTIALALDGRPRGALATVRIVASSAGREELAGTLTVSLPPSRVGNVRLSPVAEPLGGGRARAWMLVDAECDADLDMAWMAIRSDRHAGFAWRATSSRKTRGASLWVELSYEERAAGAILDCEVRAGRLAEKFQGVLPGIPGP